MKRIFVFLLLFPFSLFAQNKAIDSLEKLLTKSQEDTFRVRVFLQLCIEYKNFNPAIGIRYGEDAINLSKKINYQKGLAGGYNDIGMIYRNMSNDSLALEYHLKAIAIQKKINDQMGLGYSYSNIGIIHKNNGNNSLALEYYHKALKIQEEISDKRGIAQSYLNIGNIHKRSNQDSLALYYYLKSLELSESLNNQRGVSYSLTNIGNIYFRRHQYDVALDYHLKAVKIQEKLNDKLAKSSSLLNIGNIYTEMKNYEAALAYYNQAMNIQIELKNKSEFAAIYTNIGSVYARQKKYKEAIQVQKKGLDIASGIDDKERLKLIYEELANNYTALKEYKMAHEYYRLYSQMKDTLLNEKISKQINELQIQYETEKKEQENVLLKKNNEIQQLKLRRSRVWIYSLSSFLALSLIIFTLLYNRYRIKRKLQLLEQQRKEADIRQQMTELELKALRAQMDPHFIFNCINSIQHCIDNNDLEAANHYLSKFARLLRLILETSRNNYIRLADEIKLLELYLEMESLRFQNKFEYEIKTEDGLDTENIEIPTMLIQPYAENALKHGIRHKAGNGKVTIRFKTEQDNLIVEVADNGIGRKQSEELKGKNAEPHHSLGMTVTRERLEVLNAQKGNSAQIRIHDLVDEQQQPLGTKVEINIPI